METETPCQDSFGKSAYPATERDTTAQPESATNATEADTSAHHSGNKQSKNGKPASTAEETDTCLPDQGTTPSRSEETRRFSPHARNAEAQDAMNNAPDAPQSADNCQPAVTTPPDAAPPENAVSGATGTEAAVCADIAERQRRGIAKYGTTVADNPLSVAQWLTHAYEEVLDLAIYLKRTIHEIETTNDPTGSRRMAGSVTGKLRRPRAPGSGRKPIPCPNCGAEKSIGMTTINRVPTRRCKACHHVVKQYPNLAKATA